MRIPRVKRVLLLTAAVAVVCCAVRLWPRAPILASYPASSAVYAANGDLLRLTIARDGAYRLPVPLADISPRYIDAVLLHEDQHFWRHPGVNPWALVRSAGRTFFVRDRRVGGSTITMQLARKLYGIDSSRITGKFAQVLRALQLELTYSKRDILEAYLNLAPFGGNIEGVGAASLVYFHKRATDLTLSDAMTLAVVPQSPARRTPLTSNRSLHDARAQLYVRWAEVHGANARDAALVAAPVAGFTSRELPFRAPHATTALLRATATDSMADVLRGTAATEIRSTIDVRLQRLLERHARGYVERQRRFGVENTAMLLVDRRDMSVRAAVGSADFFDTSIAGQNDGTRARRSPGSTLKPFIYALAVDQGLLHPMTVLRDSPQAFGPYAPENFDGEFAGPVTAQDALIRSRNVPAVQVGVKLANPSFYAFLRSAGIGGLAPEQHYGIAVYLGGAEATMRELVALYAALANGGELRPLRDHASTPTTEGARLLSDAASFIALDMLANNPRPAQAFANSAVRSSGPVAWKTGTSNGLRDAWSIGVFDQYVLAVWIGNFDGRANPAFVGAHTAAPLFFQVVDAIRATRSTDIVEPWRAPASVRRVQVCAGSGDLPNQWCPQRVATWYVPGVSPIRVSQLHRQVRVDARTGLVACGGTAERFVRSEIYEFWPSDLAELFDRAGLPRRAPPARDPQCAEPSDNVGRDPLIESPRLGVSYVMRGAEAAPLQLRAVADSAAAELYWFADGSYLGRAQRGGALEWRPARAGSFRLRVVDDAGRAAERPLHVAFAD
jgi:penicillin-binding protein 1C